MDECIYHHGIKGQKWYVRRYQNKDGTLTSAGKARYSKLQTKRDAIEAEQRRLVPDQQKKTPNPHGKKSVFDMTDDELNTEIARLGLEKQYKSFMNDLYPKLKKERYFNGRKVVGEIMSGSLTALGKNVVENAAGRGLNKFGAKLGLDFDLYTKEKKEKKN